MSTVKFSTQNMVFFSELRKRVDSYFKQNNIKSTGNFKLYAKTVILLAAFFASYIILVFFTPSILISIAICSFLGLCMALIGFNIMHDGAHGSYSKYKWLNETMAYSLNMMGGATYLWKLKHNVNHHTFTNVEGLDDDIDIRPFMRIHLEQKKYWFHRFQHIYGLLLYGVTYLFWIFYQDFKKYFSSKIAIDTKLQKMSLKEHVIFWVTKLFYIAAFLVLPIYFVGFVQTLVGYGIAVFVTGLTIAVVFQLAHVIEDVSFVKSGERVVDTEWAIHQINTTANFATKSKIVTWMLGGLNFQVEHHLFPKISHVHYPKINQILKDTCKEFNVAYKEFPTVVSAVKSHLLYLKRVGVA
ncbi:MAG: acyl-CoA desaturase [Bacteroidetes bacterium]|nr:acyl-CoA desaturase [Bacteroidota bacterium]